MIKIKYTQDIMTIMVLFDKITNVPLKDCFEDKNHIITFVVDYKNISRAVGKSAMYVKRLQQILKRKIRILGFHPDVQEFIKYIIYPLQISSIDIHDGVLILKDDDRKTKSLLIGRNAQNLQNITEIVRRYFPDINGVKVM